MEGTWTATVKRDIIYLKVLKSGNVFLSDYSFTAIEFSKLLSGGQTAVVIRDAGIMTIQGRFKGVEGTGSFSFKTAANFKSALRNLNFAYPEEWEYLVYFLADMNLHNVEQLYKNGYADTKDQLLALASYKIDPDFIKSWEAYGYDSILFSNLIGLKAVGATAAYGNGFKALGYQYIPPQTLIKLKAHDISPDYVKAFNDIGFEAIPPNTILAAKACGLTAKYVALLKLNGQSYNKLEDYVGAKNVELASQVKGHSKSKQDKL